MVGETRAIWATIEEMVTSRLWDELKMTYVGAEIEANWEALYRIISLFRKVALEVGMQLRFTYPENVDRGTIHYLRKMRNLNRNVQGKDY